MFAIQGLIERRILLNYRVAPEVLAALLPEPFEPQVVGGYGVAGICLIRLKEIRPVGLPAAWGLSSENAAHRIAVQWKQDGQLRSGVYIPRRDTSSRLNTYIGGRLFPGAHNHARFSAEETADRFRLRMRSHDEQTRIDVDAERSDVFAPTALFGSLDDVSRFFQAGSLGYSPHRSGRKLEGLELQTSTWKVTPLRVHTTRSSFFEDRSRFPAGSAQFDHAVLMQDIPHRWQVHRPLRAMPRANVAAA